MRFFHTLFIILFVTSCSWFESNIVSPGFALVDFSFNKSIKNKGLLDINVISKYNYKYSTGVIDSCLNLTGSSNLRMPLQFEFPNVFNVDDYDGFSFFMWVEKSVTDYEPYMLAGWYSLYGENQYKGWKLSTPSNGGWKWSLSDGQHEWTYTGNKPNMAINNGDWVQVGFALSRLDKTARFFYNGVNVGIVSIEGCDSINQQGVFSIGCDPMSYIPTRETFNGLIDEVQFFGRALKNTEAQYLFQQAGKKIKNQLDFNGENFSVMTWNIYHGGSMIGRQVGIDRIVEIIKVADVDIVCLQEASKAGEKIAQLLNYYCYQRSDNLYVLSRFPLGESYNVFKAIHSGGVRVLFSDKKSALICPIWLSTEPDAGAFVSGGGNQVDSLIAREETTRGVELRFILSELNRLNGQVAKEPLIVAGCFNSGSHFDWTQKNIKAKGLVVNFSVSQMMLKNGYVDSYRKFYPNEVLNSGNTFSPLFKEAFKDRIDYIYYKERSLKVIDAFLIDSHPISFPSDHAALVTRFQFIN